MNFRNYTSSSSFKMAMLFTILLGISFISMIYLIHQNYEVLKQYKSILFLLFLSMVLMIIVIAVSYFISIYVVSKINHIAGIAQKIMQTGDLSQRIEISSKWDDLSALAHILNELFARVDNLMIGVREVSDNIAHDLRTPLTRLRSQLSDLSISVPEKNSDEVSAILMEADRLLDTFKALLRISNIEKGKRNIEPKKLDLNELLQDVMGLYEPLMEEKGVKLISNTFSYALLADKHLLFQAFANILDNALKFTPVHGEIEMTSYLEGKHYCVVVSDTGLGISQKNRKKVFDRFYREDESRTLPGNGLGLSLVKAIVESHQGNIEIIDNVPCGLKIIVSLPVDK